MRKLPEPLKKDHRGLVQRRAGAGRTGPATANVGHELPDTTAEGRSHAKRKRTGGETGFAPSAEIFERAIAENPDTRFVLRLYVSGMTARSRQAIDNIRQLCEEHLAGRHDLEIIDIYQQPALARTGRSLPSPRWSRGCPCHYGCSSATWPIQNALWWCWASPLAAVGTSDTTALHIKGRPPPLRALWTNCLPCRARGNGNLHGSARKTSRCEPDWRTRRPFCCSGMDRVGVMWGVSTLQTMPQLRQSGPWPRPPKRHPRNGTPHG